jgi:hypothetical protein
VLDPGFGPLLMPVVGASYVAESSRAALFCMLGPHMESESLDPYALDAKWQANERELNRIRAMPGLDREMHRGRRARLLCKAGCRPEPSVIRLAA